MRRLYATFGLLLVTGAGVAIGCGDDDDVAPPKGVDASAPETSTLPDAEADADIDAGDGAAEAGPPRVEVATGTHLVNHAAHLEGVTEDGFVVFTDVDADNHQTANVIPLAGGAETKIVASTGTGKDDLRYQIDGKVVFAWSDRGNRIATLTMWSLATGIVSIGPNVRPGRAAATPDGTNVLYIRDVTDAGANVVAGPIATAPTTIATLNSADDDCWRDVDLVHAGANLLAKYCPTGTTGFLIKSFDPATPSTTDLNVAPVTAVEYGSTRVLWTESGVLKTATADGGAALTLADGGVDEFVLANDESVIAYRSGDAVAQITPDAGARAAIASGVVQLGAIGPKDGKLLYATMVNDAGATDVKSIQLDGGGLVTIAAAATSCPNCLFESFSLDEDNALVIDPIDPSSGVGPVRIVDTTTGATIATVGTKIVTAAHAGDAGTRFVFLDETPDPTLTSGAYYGITSRSLGATDDSVVIAKGVDGVEIEVARGLAVFSFPGTDPNAGVWVSPLP